MKKIILSLLAVIFIHSIVHGQSNPEVVFEDHVLNYKVLNDGFIFHKKDTLWFTNGEPNNAVALVEMYYTGSIFGAEIEEQFVFVRILKSPDSWNFTYSLWATDGTVEGTKELKDCGSTLPSILYITMNNHLFFTYDDGIHGKELWISDGTAHGTKLLKDIYEGERGGLELGYQESFVYFKFKDKIYFNARDSVHGTELWVSDLTEEGTYMLKDIVEGPSTGVGSSSIIALNDELLFTANDSIHGKEIWKTDGTEQGTQLLKDINPGPGNSYPSLIQRFIINNKLVFTANDGVHGHQLWITDGTEQGTYMIKEVDPNPYGSIALLTLLNDKIYFRISNSSSQFGFWVTDGTEEGTIELERFNTTYFYPAFYSIDNKLYFIHENILWTSDGTASGTYILKDPASDLVFFNDKIYLAEREHKDSAYNFHELDVHTGSTNFIGQLQATNTYENNISYRRSGNYLVCLPVKDLQGAAMYEAFFVSIFNSDDNSMTNYDLSEIFGKDYPIYGESYFPFFIFKDYFYFNIAGGEFGSGERFKRFVRIELPPSENEEDITATPYILQPLNITIYPNPANTKVNVTGIADNFEFIIRDIGGKIVKMGRNEKSINIQSLPSGLYFIQISDGEQNIQSRFVKQ